MDKLYFKNQAETIENLSNYYKFKEGEHVYVVVRVLGDMTTDKKVFSNKSKAEDEEPPRYGYIGIVSAKIKKIYRSTEKVRTEDTEVVEVREGKKL